MKITKELLDYMDNIVDDINMNMEALDFDIDDHSLSNDEKENMIFEINTAATDLLKLTDKLIKGEK